MWKQNSARWLAGMMVVKKRFQEADGDFEQKPVDILREQGQK